MRFITVHPVDIMGETNTSYTTDVVVDNICYVTASKIQGSYISFGKGQIWVEEILEDVKSLMREAQ